MASVFGVALAAGAGVIVVFLLRAARRYAIVDRLERSRGRSRGRARRLFPEVAERWLGQGLEDAGLNLTVDHALHIWLATTGGAATIGFLFTTSVGIAAALALSTAIAGPVALRSARGRRARLVAAAIPVTVEHVASELRAGGTIATAIGLIAAGDGVLASDFQRVDTRVRLGADLPDALQAWTLERRAAGVEVVAGALAMCAAFGGRAADALDGLAASLRDRLAVIAEARALSAQARLSALVVGGTPLLYLAFTAISDPRALHSLTGTAVGRACVGLGLALEGIGAWWMRRIVRAGSVW